MDRFVREWRLAWRSLLRSPLFATTVIVTLALGLGANVAMFGVVDRLLYRPLAWLRDPAAVHRLYWQWENSTGTRTTTSTTYRRYLDLLGSTSSFSQFAAVAERDAAVGEGEAANERRIAAVSASYFAFFEAQPALGRFFTPDEDRLPVGTPVAVLSYDYWQTAYGGRDVRGETIPVANLRAEIVGVAPKGFAGVNDALPPVVWVPITAYAGSAGTGDAKTYFSRYSWAWLNVLVRRKPGVSIDAASADASRALRDSWRVEGTMDPYLPALDAAHPRAVVASVRLGAGPEPALQARTAVWAWAVATFVLIIACANVANLTLARALQRQREAIVRLAIGASRRRLLSQSILEHITLTLLGGVAAIGVAQWGGAIISRILLSTAIPLRAYTDWRLLAVAFGVAIVVGLFLGVVPIAFAGRGGDIAGALRTGARASARDGGRLRAALLVMQVSLSVALLVGAGLFVRSLQAARAMRLGYDAEHVLLVNRVIRGLPMEDSVQIPLRRTLLEAAQGLPEVEHAAWVSSAPFVSTSSTALYVQGIDSVGRLGNFTYQATTPDYFAVMGTRILRGRGLTADDRLGSSEVMVVSESMARTLWGSSDALGKCVTVWRRDEPCRTVVGIAEDMVQNDVAGGTRLHFYLPIDQFTRTWGNGLLLKLRGDPAVQGERVRAALQRSLPGASYLTIRSLQEIVDDALSSWRLGAMMFVACGVLALIVAGVGLYGVIAYDVEQRSHELGVRAAVGARRSHLISLVVGQSVRYALTGAAIGLGAALLAGRWLEPLLFHQSPRDPLVLVGVSVAMLLVALTASLSPALRAARTPPVRALRHD